MFDGGVPEQIHRFIASPPPPPPLPPPHQQADERSLPFPQSFSSFTTNHQVNLDSRKIIHHHHHHDIKEFGVTTEWISHTDHDGDNHHHPWCSDEVLALLRFRSTVENWFPEFTWDLTSRKLAEIGFKRSPQECKEKFEEEERRYFNTSDNINDHNYNNKGNNYRTFSEIEAFYHHGHVSSEVGDNQNKRHNSLEGTRQKLLMEEDKRDEDQGQVVEEASIEKCNDVEKVGNVEDDVKYSSSSSSLMRDKKKRKRKKEKERFGILKGFCEGLVRNMIAQQEEMHKKLLEDMVMKEEEKVAREEKKKKTMPVFAEPSSSKKTIGHHIRIQRNLQPISTVDEPLIPKPSRVSKSAMSSFFLLPQSNETTRKKSNSFIQSGSFRGLGCTSSASQQVSVPAVIRSSADWDARDFKIKKKNKNKGSSYNGGSIKILSESSGNCAASSPDVWCGPGVGFSTDAVVGESDPPRRNIPVRRKIDNIQKEGSSLLPRRSINQESNPYFDSDLNFLTSRAEQSDRYHHHRHIRQPYPDGFAEEMMMMQNGFVMGGVRSSYDHFRDLRLNVDNMTYEQLLELGDRIGHVNTGLNEKQIKSCLRKVKPFSLEAPLADKKCIICQDEYEVEDEVGRLRCGHKFHINCVKQWLVRKNSCPVCKTMPYGNP